MVPVHKSEPEPLFYTHKIFEIFILIILSGPFAACAAAFVVQAEELMVPVLERKKKNKGYNLFFIFSESRVPACRTFLQAENSALLERKKKKGILSIFIKDNM